VPDHPNDDPATEAATDAVPDTATDTEPTAPVEATVPTASGSGGTPRTPVWRNRRVQLGAVAAGLVLVGALGGWGVAAATSDDGHDPGAGFSHDHGWGQGRGDHEHGPEGFGPGGFGPGGPARPGGRGGPGEDEQDGGG
jgi:hypothetical protein